MSDEEEAEIGEENVIADLPVLSVIIKEEEGVLDYSVNLIFVFAMFQHF